MLRDAWLSLGWVAFFVATVVVGPADERSLLVAAPLRPADDQNLRTYRFTARVTKNGGVTPVEVGAVVKGTITYVSRGERLYHVRGEDRGWPRFADRGLGRAISHSIPSWQASSTTSNVDGVMSR